MNVAPESMAVLWLGAGAVVLWMWLPAVMSALGLTLWRVSLDDNAAAIEPTGSAVGYEELFGQLRRLGFVPVGTRCKTCWFFLYHWRRNFQARLFEVPEGDCLAVTYKLRQWDPWRLCFVTGFSDGALVETANQMESLRIEEPDHFRWGLATPDRALLLEQHREACRRFAAATSRTIAKMPIDLLNRFELQHAVRYHLQHHRWTGLKVLSNSLWFFGGSLLLALRFGHTIPSLLPINIMVCGILWPVVHASLFRIAAGKFRADDANRQRHQPMSGHLERSSLS